LIARSFAIAGAVIAVGCVGAGVYSVWQATQQLAAAAETVERARAFRRAPAALTSRDSIAAGSAVSTNPFEQGEERRPVEIREDVTEPVPDDESIDVTSLDVLLADADQEVRDEARILIELAATEESSADVVLDTGDVPQ
jgi:hypothetical protein